MTRVMLEPRSSVVTTDGAGVGFEGSAAADRSAGSLTELTRDLTTAVSDAYWAFILQGELEDAFDTALLRAAFADTPVLSGSLAAWSA
jgi:hypothetical protein